MGRKFLFPPFRNRESAPITRGMPTDRTDSITHGAADDRKPCCRIEARDVIVNAVILAVLTLVVGAVVWALYW